MSSRVKYFQERTTDFIQFNVTLVSQYALYICMRRILNAHLVSYRHPLKDEVSTFHCVIYGIYISYICFIYIPTEVFDRFSNLSNILSKWQTFLITFGCANPTRNHCLLKVQYNINHIIMPIVETINYVFLYLLYINSACSSRTFFASL